jgi:hypothetical protein
VLPPYQSDVALAATGPSALSSALNLTCAVTTVTWALPARCSCLGLPSSCRRWTSISSLPVHSVIAVWLSVVLSQDGS